MNSIECAEALNSFNDDTMNAKIVDLVNEAICLELPECCECCQLNILMIYAVIYQEIIATKDIKK